MNKVNLSPKALSEYFKKEVKDLTIADFAQFKWLLTQRQSPLNEEATIIQKIEFNHHESEGVLSVNLKVFYLRNNSLQTGKAALIDFMSFEINNRDYKQHFLF